MAAAALASSTGLYFDPVAQLAFTGTTYVVPYRITTEDLLSPLASVRAPLEEEMWSVENVQTNDSLVNVLRSHMMRLNYNLLDSEAKVRSFLSYFIHTKHTRHERGALNIVGTVSNALFGTATQGQIDSINDRLDTLNELTEKERVQLNVHSELLNATIRNQKAIEGALQGILNATAIARGLIRSFSLKTIELTGHLQASECISLLQGVYAHIDVELTQLTSGIKEMVAGHISPYLLNDTVLLNVLGEASTRTSGILFPARQEFLAVYRDLIEVASVPSPTPCQCVVFYILIPTRGNPGEYFSLYQVHSLPIPVDSNHSVVIHDTHTYLAVGDSRRVYTLMDSLDHCRRHVNFLLCKSLLSIYDSSATPSCEINIFLGRASQRLCKKYLIKNSQPVFTRIEDAWYYSSRDPITFTLKCPTHRSKVHKDTFTLTGTGSVTLPVACAAYSDAIILPATTTYTHTKELTLNVSFPPIILPDLLSPDEAKLIADLGQLNSIPSSTQPVFLDPTSPLALAHIPPPPPPPPPHATWWGWFPVLVTLLITPVLVVAALWLLRRFRRHSHLPPCLDEDEMAHPEVPPPTFTFSTTPRARPTVRFSAYPEDDGARARDSVYQTPPRRPPRLVPDGDIPATA